MKITTHIDVDAPAETAWEFIGERYGEIGDWITLLETSYLVGPLEEGCSRTCVSTNGKETTETLTVYDPENRRLTYVADAIQPPIFLSAENNWSVTPTSSATSRVTSVADIRFKWWAIFLAPLVAVGLRVTLNKVRDQVKYAIENGRPHPDVLKQNAKIKRSTTGRNPRNA